MSNQQYRHTNRKLSPAELVELLTDQHSGWVDDPIMLWLSQSLEDMADVIQRAIKCGESDPFYADGIPRFVATKALAAARAFSDGQDSFDDWRQS